MAQKQDTEFNIEEFLRQIDAYKDKHGITDDSEIADKCGFHRSVLTKLRAGDRKPSVSTFTKICRVLDFDANDF